MSSIISVGGIVRSFNGIVVSSAGGAPCCCGTCPYYYKADLCNEQPCTELYSHIYVCGTATCPANPNAGNYVGPIQVGTVIQYQNYCYRVNSLTRYCPPPTGGQDAPPPCIPMPTRAPIIDTVIACWDNCANANCPPLDGWYLLSPCNCSGSPSVPAYVHCEVYETYAATMPCPVWTVEGLCLRVAPGTMPIPNPPDPPFAYLITGAPGYPNCCECCFTQTGCSRCTEPFTSARAINCDQIVTDIGQPDCEGCNQATYSLTEYSASRLVQTWRSDFGRYCASTLQCFRRSGPLEYEFRNIEFFGDCTAGGPVSCGNGACNVVVPEAPFNVGPWIPVQVQPCAPGQSFHFAPVASGVPIGCQCTTGNASSDCRNAQWNWSIGGGTLPECGQLFTYCGRVSLNFGNSPCSNPPCLGGGGITLLDGTPASTASRVVSGCKGCGAGQERTEI